ncbi:Os10g0473050 [Oryza sativa Japonica Group]|uniref:Os10g0473050 protein n=1 Tax=Oryza sativa subsp. japonica TaxID=39947 RepID=A0A0P0XVK0_ORYSJ|nr:Os10g0473050 [Oryza sativa Japonica Group]
MAHALFPEFSLLMPSRNHRSHPFSHPIRIEIEAEGEVMKVDQGERMRQTFVGRSRRRPPSAAPPFHSRRHFAWPSVSCSRRPFARATPPLWPAVSRSRRPSAPTGGELLVPLRSSVLRSRPPILSSSLDFWSEREGSEREG